MQSMDRQEKERWGAMDGTGVVEKQPARSPRERVFGGYLCIDSVEDLQPVSMEDILRMAAEVKPKHRIEDKSLLRYPDRAARI